MPPQPEAAADLEAHHFPLFADGSRIGRLVWRTQPRPSAGWFLVPDGGAPRKLSVDPGIDELAAHARDDHVWELHAEVAAILSTALALDAAERTIRGRPERRGRRFGRPETTHCEIHLRGIAQAVLARAVPEMAVSCVSDVVTLEGDLAADAVPTVLRRLTLLGGTIVQTGSEEA